MWSAFWLINDKTYVTEARVMLGGLSILRRWRLTVIGEVEVLRMRLVVNSV
jgi:hypothetical protein